MKRAPLEPEQMPGEPATGGRLRLPDDTAHYLRDVLRRSEGDRVELFDGRGRVLEVVIRAATSNGVMVEVEDDYHSRRNESPCRLTLFQAVPKGKRWRVVLEKATELGVARIVPLRTRRTVVQISDKKMDRKLERWDQIVAGAARQSERTVTPEVGPQTDLSQAIEEIDDDVLHLVPYLGEELDSLVEILRERSDAASKTLQVGLWIGPEGGFASEEVDELRAAGALACRLGPRILRSETAGVVAPALVQGIIGDLR